MIKKIVECEECSWTPDEEDRAYWMKRVNDIPRSHECHGCGKTALTKKTLPLCSVCGKPHNHRHICFTDGSKSYTHCYECCDVSGCVEGKKKGLIDSRHCLVKPKGDVNDR